MNAFRKLIISTVLITMMCMFFALQAGAVAGPKVSELAPGNTRGNKHNLSAIARQSGTATYVANVNTYQATDSPDNPKGQQICIFCHTPHNANVEGGAPLWNHTLSTQTFSRYSSGTLQIRLKSATTTATAGFGASWQPDGSSKLCLSCHDGITSLGAVRNGVIAMEPGRDVITSIASFNPSNNKMKTGHHPVSFTYNSTIAGAIDAGKGLGPVPPVYVMPSLGSVKLDKNGKMQCTTCHNAHQNQTDDNDCYVDAPCAPTSRKKAPFWVYGASGVAPTDRDAVCQTCHPLTSPSTGIPGFTQPWLAP